MTENDIVAYKVKRLEEQVSAKTCKDRGSTADQGNFRMGSEEP